MPKALVLICGFVFAISTSAYGQEIFTVSGEISFQEEKGEFLVYLKTQEELEERGEPALPSRSLVIKPNPQQLQAKKVTFKFVAVPKGFYCILCVQDLNKNGKLDYSAQTGIPIEPLGYSGQAFFHGQWEDIKFEVDKDISGIEIKL
ncbi:MAG: DUF2141 domain-containing protein [Deltaproteobacteria bacterium]|jgi:uncharacterized protein (DUF2141 family)|nr:DUF2141 domain-containing protein [Deltaproteobacteria bacterium]